MWQMKTLVVIAVFAALLVGCSDKSVPTVAPSVTAQQQASASLSMGLTFPPETRFLLYNRASENQHFMPLPDDCVHLKIELPASALATFLNQAAFSFAKWTNTNSQIVDVPGWPEWQPSKVSKYRFDQFELPKGRFLNVLIDDDQDDLKIVYLFWAET